jgi:hypothetical protein
VEQRKKTGGSACYKGSRATRRHLQQVRLLFRDGDLTTDGSGLGVSVPGSGCFGFAAATHGTPSSGGLACRPDSGVVVQRRGDFGFSHGWPPVLLSPSFSFSPSFPLFLRRTGRNPQGRRRILGDEAGNRYL